MGTYFGRRGWCVYPASVQGAPEASHNIEDISYNDQPQWKLGDLKVGSIVSATALLREFREVSHEASQAFLWMTNYPSHDPTSDEEWNIKLHGWKHVSFQDFEESSRSVLNLLGKTPLRRTVFSLTPDEQERLITGASSEDPASVARLRYLCGNNDNLRRVLSIHGKTQQETQELLTKIPLPADLGKKYVELIFATPGKKSNGIRKKLEALTSAGNILGAPDGGRPENPHNWADVVSIRAMAFSLVKQIRAAREFLRKTNLREGNIAETSLENLGIEEESVENGRRRTVTKLQAAIIQLTDKATGGDLKALQLLTSLLRSAEERGSQDVVPNSVNDDLDKKVISGILSRISAFNKEDSENANEPIQE